MSTIAERLFDSHVAVAELEDKLPFEFERLGWDQYDRSLEIYGVAPDYRLSEADLQVIREAGFAKCYVNHTDKWETHYGFRPGIAPKPWRVSYPHRRGDSGGIWVEDKVPEAWPVGVEGPDGNGYVKVIRAEGIE